MTTIVTVKVPVGANYKAIVQHIDQDGDQGKESLAGVVPPGETHEFHAHLTREIIVSERALTEEDINYKPGN